MKTNKSQTDVDREPFHHTPGFEPMIYSRDLLRRIVRMRSKAGSGISSYADAIYLLRTRMGLTQSDLAQRLGVTRWVISKAEEKRAVPRPLTLLRLSEMAATIGLKECQTVLGAESSREQDRITQRARRASGSHTGIDGTGF